MLSINNVEKVNKYHNKKIVIDDIQFSSKIESDVYIKLKELNDAKIISNLILQPKYILQDSFKECFYDGKTEKVKSGTIREITYISDFEFVYKDYTFTLEVKGMMDQKYPIKRKMFLSKYGNTNLFMEIRRIRELKMLNQIMDDIISEKEKDK